MKIQENMNLDMTYDDKLVWYSLALYSIQVSIQLVGIKIHLIIDLIWWMEEIVH